MFSGSAIMLWRSSGARGSALCRLQTQFPATENDNIFDLFCDAGFKRSQEFYTSQTLNSIEPEERRCVDIAATEIERHRTWDPNVSAGSPPPTYGFDKCPDNAVQIRYLQAPIPPGGWNAYNYLTAPTPHLHGYEITPTGVVWGSTGI